MPLAEMGRGRGEAGCRGERDKEVSLGLGFERWSSSAGSP